MINGKRGITSDTALRLAKYFGNSPEFWMNLQQMYDLSKTRVEYGERIEQEVRWGRGLREGTVDNGGDGILIEGRSHEKINRFIMCE